MKQYSQFRAMLAITKASLRAISRSPSAMVFSFIFPFIFILIFGFIGNGGGRQHFRVALDGTADTANDVYRFMKSSASITLLRYGNSDSLETDMEKGRIAGLINIIKDSDNNQPYQILFHTTTSSSDQWPQFSALLESIINSTSDAHFKNRPQYARLQFNPRSPEDLKEIREYKTIDFILPGQLGFSLLSSGVFGVAFMFFNLRSTLVLKRFFATPLSRTYIILGEGLSRVIFQMLTALVIILAGRFLFGFTLINGAETFLEMLLLSFIGLLIFMGFGFIVSGVAKNESTIPPLANLITMPQFLLGGTFFSIDAFPHWLQVIARLMPLTYLNQAMRSVAFEGVHFWNVTTNFSLGSLHWQMPVVFILLLWFVIVYAVAVKLFKWE